MLKKAFIILAISSIYSSTAYAAPQITAASSGWSHGTSVSIAGSQFGVKSTVTPLMFDDFESGAFKSQWIAKLPNGAQSDNDHNMGVRASNWRNVASPHTRSSYYAAGGHDPDGYEAIAGRNYNASGPNVMISFNVSPAVTSGQGLYVRYYYRHDPRWDGPFNNLKISDFSNWDAQQANMWPHNQGGNDYYFEYRALPFSGDIGLHTVHSNMSNCSGYDYPCDHGMNPPEPHAGWHLYEYVILHNTSNGYCRVYVDNMLMYEKGLSNDCNEFLYDIKSIWIGGYFRATLSPESGDEDAYRYVDDVYADRGFQRIVLTNNQNYNSATIIEPQIPITWSDGTISCKVNLGKLTGSTAYLFVFDASNNHNVQGYPVNLTTSADTIPPAAPTGVNTIIEQ